MHKSTDNQPPYVLYDRLFVPQSNINIQHPREDPFLDTRQRRESPKRVTNEQSEVISWSGQRVTSLFFCANFFAKIVLIKKVLTGFSLAIEVAVQ